MDWSELDTKFIITAKNIIRSIPFVYKNSIPDYPKEIKACIEDMRILGVCVSAILLHKRKDSIGEAEKTEITARINVDDAPIKYKTHTEYMKEFERLKQKYSSSCEGLEGFLGVLIRDKLDICSYVAYDGHEYKYVDYILFLFKNLRELFEETPLTLEEHLTFFPTLKNYYIFPGELGDTSKLDCLFSVRLSPTEWENVFDLLYNSIIPETHNKLSLYILNCDKNTKISIKQRIQNKLKQLIFSGH